MASPEKRCYYEVLGLSRDCSADEIRSAYRRLALQRHPDKLVRAGVPEAEATAAFQELVNAYEVLSDAKERAWYDSHRNQILFSSGSGDGSSSTFVPDLFGFFSNSVFSGYTNSGRGFYKVYGDLFEKIYANELNFARKLGLPLPREAPVIGNLESPYTQVAAFYSYWMGFSTVLDFFWADQYDVMAGPNRKSRRLMEDENKKLRKKAKREYNDTVRGLAEFIKKRDKRVIDMQIKRNEEMEKKREQEKQRKKELERQKIEMARKYEEQDWAKVDETEELYDEEAEDMEEERNNELYCVICKKKFKSDKQWKNHEQSKKHKEKVAELREAYGEEDNYFEKTQGNGNEMEEKEVDGDSAGYLSVDDSVNELQKQFADSVHLHGDDTDGEKTESSEANEFVDVDKYDDRSNTGADLGSDDDEASFLQAMLSGHKNRTKTGKPKASAKKVQQEKVDDYGMETMEYNDIKGSRKNRGSRRRRARRQDDDEEEVIESTKGEVAERNDDADANGKQGNDIAEPSAHQFPESEANSKADDAAENGRKHPQQGVNKKRTTKKENVSKAKVTSKGRKQKGTANSSNTCEKCGEEFETRNKLHKHLGETDHASLKSR